MREQFKNITAQANKIWQRTKPKKLCQISFVLPFLFSFLLLSAFIEVTLARSATIRAIKNEIVQLEKYLNALQLDFSYDKITFDSIFFNPLVEIENLQIYNRRGNNLWQINIAHLTGNSRLFSSQKLHLTTTPNIKLTYNQKSFSLTAETTAKIIADSNGNLDSLVLRLSQANIKDFAKMKEVKLQVKSLPTLTHDAVMMPSLETSLEIRDVKLNGLLKYPLTSEIQRIYAETKLMGTIRSQDDLYLSIENWLHNDGFVDITSLLINWDPLVLAGKGTLRFNEKMQPRINLTTSSKALFKLLQDLQDNKFINRKGAFVANILLNAKAYKLRPNDKHLTVTTPITYHDGKLAVENITIKTLKP